MPLRNNRPDLRTRRASWPCTGFAALGSDLCRSPNANYPTGISLLSELLAALANSGYDSDTIAGVAHGIVK